MTTMSVSPETPREWTASPGFWQALRDGSIFLEKAFLGEIPESPEFVPEPSEEPEDSNLCPECGGHGVVDLTPGVSDPQLQEDGECRFCEGTGLVG